MSDHSLGGGSESPVAASAVGARGAAASPSQGAPSCNGGSGEAEARALPARRRNAGTCAT
eukprot:scaffold14546_cov121-Isochrysis_galbana.AAC.1